MCFFQNKARLSGLLNAKSGLFAGAPVDLCRRSGTGVGKYNSSTRTIWKLSSVGWESSKGLRTECGSMHCRAEARHLDSSCLVVLCSRVAHLASMSERYRRTHTKIKKQGGTWSQTLYKTVFLISNCVISVSPSFHCVMAFSSNESLGLWGVLFTACFICMESVGSF